MILQFLIYLVFLEIIFLCNSTFGSLRNSALKILLLLLLLLLLKLYFVGRFYGTKGATQGINKIT